jgi:hypothetical protein
MRKVFGWILDPYVHIFLIGLLLVRLAMGFGGDDPAGSARAAAGESAQEAEWPWYESDHLAVKLPAHPLAE